jgi:poly(3-hydroxyalkanoate) synthetase
MVDLVCLCQGAWLGAIYTSKYPHRVARYANFAGPINTKTGAKPNKMEDYCNSMSLEYHKMVVALNNGIQPGLFQWYSFSMVSPAEVYFGRWCDLAWAIYDGNTKEYKKLRRNNEWYDHPIDLDGLWFLECLENHFKDNKLYLGSWIIGNEPVDLSKITCDVFLYGGEDDIITHPEQVFGLADVISSKNVKKTTFPKAGHTKVFVGTNELKQFVGDFF